MKGQALRDWLKVNFYDGKHSQLGYSAARGYMYAYIDNVNDELSCVYGGFARSWSHGNTGTNPAPLNCEHTVPRSLYGDAEPMLSDIHHLFPTFGTWNNIRSNYPFGEIADHLTSKWMYLDQSQTHIPSTDRDLYSEYNNQVFEPREDHKGNCARAVFYFYTMYSAQAGQITAVGDLETLYQWHVQDPPDSLELLRNDEIETFQGNRNPYIDHPGWVLDAWEVQTTGLGSPQDVRLIASPTHLQLIWNSQNMATGYSVYRSLDALSFTLLSSLGEEDTSYTDMNVVAGQRYYYYVEAFNASGAGGGSAIVSGQILDGGSGLASELFISEYIEGSSYNKALEVANFTGASVDMAAYSLKKQTNGSEDWGSELVLHGELTYGDVFVLTHVNADPVMQAQADVIGGGIVTFNGNDAIGLFRNGVLIDLIGSFGSDANYAKNVTMVRKPSVNKPSALFLQNEWELFSTDFFADLGYHRFDVPTTDLEEMSGMDGIEVFAPWPNPFDKQLQLSCQVYQSMDLQVDLFDAQGQLVRQLWPFGTIVPGSYQLEIETSALPTGLYVLAFRAESVFRFFRVMKK
ncbi:MAG: endonuclease [Bacteroidota bacterium]